MIAARRTFLTLFIVQLLTFVNAQVLPVKYLGISQGLSNNSVVSMYQDNNGFMWFGTYDGLNRYDGYGFRVFRNVLGDTSSLLSNTIYTIIGDESHNIWVGGQKGACVYNPSSAAFSSLWYNSANNGIAQPLQDNIHQIKPILPGTMLAGSQSLGLILFDGYKKTGSQVPLHLKGGAVFNYDAYAIAEKAGSSFCWVMVRQIGLCKYVYSSQKLLVFDGALQNADCLYLDKDNRLWIGNGEGLFLYDETLKKLSGNYLTIAAKVTNIMQDGSETLWAATDGEGVFTLTKNDKQASRYLLADGSSIVKSNAVWSLFEDRSGHKWIGTLRGGISMLDFSPSTFEHIVYKPPVDKRTLEQNFILSFCEDDRQNVWIGTDGAGLRYWDRSKNTFTNYNHTPGVAGGLSSNFITSIALDSFKNTWIATWFGGIDRIDKNGKMEHFTCYNTAGQKENNIWLVYEDRQKNVWACASSLGSFYLFNRQTNTFQVFDRHITELQSIAETEDGQLWGGNYTDLIRIDRENKKHLFYKIGYTVRCIVEDHQHRLWLGTQDGGLLLFDRNTGKTTRYSTANGLPSNTILRMLVDKQGKIWMSTYNGLSCFDPVQKNFRNFSVSDGLQSSQFSYNAGLALRSGQFLFGGINGFNIFSPDSIAAHKQQPNILLAGLAINDVPIEKDSNYVTERNLETIKSIRIPYNKAALSIDFLNLDFASPENTNYAYYLEGWDKQWNNAGSARKANYSRLQEGTYIFKVKITQSDGTWSQPYPLLVIKILPPWYRSWWAYILYLLVAAGVVYMYLRYVRTKERLRYKIRLALLEKEKEKELAEQQFSMFTNISHEFRTPLSLIINPLKKVVNNKKGETQLSNDDLFSAYRNARRLLSLVDQLLLFRKADSGADALNISSFDLVALCKEVYECFRQQAIAQNIHFNFRHQTECIMMYGDYEKLEIALFNLLSNAFKFTPVDGTVEIIILETDTQAEINITDTGCGISAFDKERIFEKFQQAAAQRAQKSGFGIGLYLVKYFIEKHKGSVNCSSEVGKGSTFTVALQKETAFMVGQNVVAKTAQKSELVDELTEQDGMEETKNTDVADLNGAKAEEIITEKESILIIDDNEDVRKYLMRLFAANYLTYGTDGAEEGYHLAEKHSPDLIISDISMNGMDGIELCRKIKQSSTLGHIPIILLTAATNTEMKLQGISGGADDYITKPFDSDLLMARVETLLKNRTQLRKYFLDSITLKENTQKVPAEYQEFLKKCIETIEANLDKETFDIKMFARAMGMSHSTLYVKIKAISGQTLNAFVRSIRLRRAAVLMLTENLNVNEAAFQVGFENAPYFRKQFVGLFGITPSEYIKKYRNSFNKDLNVVK